LDARLDLVESTSSYLNTTFSSSVDNRLDLVEATASYLNTTFSTSVDSRLDTLETAATSDDGRLDALEEYSASLKTAISASGQDLIIYGNLTVQGTQTSLNVNEVFVEDKTLTLASGSATAAAADGAGIHIAGANVTMSWDNNNNRINLNKSFYANGDLSGSILIGIGNVTAFSTSVDARLDIVEASASLYVGFSTSVDSRLDLVEATASYLNTTFSTSVDSRLDLVEATASYLNTSFSTSVDSRLDLIEQTGSNHENRIHILELSQSAFDTAIELDSTNVTIYGNLTVQGTQTAIQSNILNVKDLNITIASGSTNSAAANGAGINIDGANVTMSWSDANQRIELNKDFAATGSISSSTINGIGNVTLYSASVDSRLVSLELTGSNFSTKIANLEQHSGSVNQFTASITASFNTTSGSLNVVSQSLLNVSTSYVATSQSLNLVSSSLLTFSASQYNADSTSFDSRLDLV
jgi:hypothetical protein